MSRGHGKIERALLEILEQNTKPLHTYELTAAVFDVKPDKSDHISLTPIQLASVRRALLNLKRQDKAVDMGRVYRHGRRGWASKRVASKYYKRLAELEAKLGLNPHLAQAPDPAPAGPAATRSVARSPAAPAARSS